MRGAGDALLLDGGPAEEAMSPSCTIAEALQLVLAVRDVEKLSRVGTTTTATTTQLRQVVRTVLSLPLLHRRLQCAPLPDCSVLPQPGRRHPNRAAAGPRASSRLGGREQGRQQLPLVSFLATTHQPTMSGGGWGAGYGAFLPRPRRPPPPPPPPPQPKPSLGPPRHDHEDALPAHS